MNDLEALGLLVQKVSELYDRQGMVPGVSSTVLDAGTTPGFLTLSNGTLNQVLTKNNDGSITISRSSPSPSSPPVITSSDNNGRVSVPFAYGDATPKIIYSVPVGKTILSAQIVITQAFNGASPNLRLGDSGNLDRFFSALQNNASEVGIYGTNSNHSYGVTTNILLSIVAGSGATQGSGSILLEVS